MPDNQAHTEQSKPFDTRKNAVSRSASNVGAGERAVTTAVAGAVALWGLRRGGLLGMIGLLAGAGMAARGISGRCPMYSTMEKPGEREVAEQHGWSRAALVKHSVTVNRPRRELFDLWRDFSNLPRFMSNIERIDVQSPQRSHWVVRGPAGVKFEWDAVVTQEKPGELIAWSTTGNPDVRNAGRVEFRDAPGGRGTEVMAHIAYEPPASRLGQLFARLMGREPSTQAREDLRNFKRMVETGQLGGEQKSSEPSNAKPKTGKETEQRV